MGKIGDQIRRHPERRILNAFSVDDISTIVTNRFALPLVSNEKPLKTSTTIDTLITFNLKLQLKSNAESLIETSYRINKKCLVTLAEKTFLPRAQGLAFPKKSPLVPAINYQ